jgi:hypothetical protein
MPRRERPPTPIETRNNADKLVGGQKGTVGPTVTMERGGDARAMRGRCLKGRADSRSSRVDIYTSTSFFCSSIFVTRRRAIIARQGAISFNSTGQSLEILFESFLLFNVDFSLMRGFV